MIVIGVVALVAAGILIMSGIAQAKTSGIANGGTVTPSTPKAPSITQLISRNSLRFGVEEALIKAHIQVESSWDPNASNPGDPSWGLMGITPICAQDFGFVQDWRHPTAAEIARLKDPEVNIEIGTRYLAKLHAKYDFDAATQMYNCGEHNFNDHGVRVPDYLSKVRRYYNEFRTA